MKTQENNIIRSVHQISSEIPGSVMLVAAAKTRSLDEVETVLQAGVKNIGYNYVQEALPIIQAIGDRAIWHMIGHVQKNKAKLVARYFDMVQTVDSWDLAQLLDKYCGELQKTMPVLVEINSGEEANKTGVLPESLEELITRMNDLKNLRVQGLMTMGPRFGDPENSRPYFISARAAFDRMEALKLPNIRMQFLSMGMSNSYQIAIEEGANIVRIGTKLFGERESQ